MSEKKLALVRKMRAIFSLFSAKCLKVRSKTGDVVPFVLNRAQEYLHERIAEQLKRTGKVRLLILKGRQQGISTYIGARFYHKASMWKNINVYILAHEQMASDALFKIVDRYHNLNPLAPSTGASNAKELEFELLGSSYTVATAGKKAGGRSRTSTLFHGSEVAFWANAADHFASSVQTVPDADGTEILLETTANGPSGEFYERWQEAEAGEGDYEAVFIPWFWDLGYTRLPPEDFVLIPSEDKTIMGEDEYAELFELDSGQMFWRRMKIRELRSQDLFDQEYPATAQMAFVNSGEASYIPPLPVLKARKREVTGGGPLVMGADPAGPGGDRFSICGRRGHEVEFLEWRNKLETMDAYLWCKSVIMEHKPAKFFVDAGGIGAAVLSLLRGDEDLLEHHKNVVMGVNFGSPSQAKKARPDRAGPKNRRAEMWTRMRDWLTGEEDVSIPDLDVLQGDITSTRLKANLTNDIQLESKQDMRARNVRSPDLADSLALTFASLTLITKYEEKSKPNSYGNPDRAKASEWKPTATAGRSWMS